MEYSIPKGMFDILPSDEEKWRESDRWHYIEKVMREAALEYGFKEIRTPILERTELFIRGVGESSDIVSKEMYSFIDRGERSMTLRPEGTAPVMRSFVEKKLYAQMGLHKFFYFGPMFRYERPQAGRFRQFYQFGAEAVGIGTPEQDVELIDLLCEVCKRLQLKNLVVHINTVGDAASRAAYKEALSSYLTPHMSALSQESQVRFSKNILRILDSKDPGDQRILQGAPVLADFLTSEAEAHIERVMEMLDDLQIAYTVNDKLVRGLDYYNHTVFEITTDVLGAQNAIGGGGRFDGLIATLGGPDLPAVGFAAGLERILQTMLKQEAFFPAPFHPFVFVVPIGEAALHYAFQLVCSLRKERVPAEIDLSGKKVQHGLQLANHSNADFALVIGDEELASKKVKLKKMATREISEIPLDALTATLKALAEHTHV